MAEETETPEPVVEEPQETPPPWGSDDEFDPERAWSLITNLREEVGSLKPLAQKARDLEQEQMTEKQRLEAERDQFRQERDDTLGDLLRMRAAVKYGLDEADLDLLGTGTEEQIDARAKRLAERSGPTPLPRKPHEQLRAGSQPEDPPADDMNTLIRQQLAKR